MGTCASRRGFLLIVIALALGVLIFPFGARAESMQAVSPVISYSPSSSAYASRRSWYGENFILFGSRTTTARFFDGNSLGIELVATCAEPNATFSISLRKGAQMLGVAMLRANGFVRAEWPNVGPGNYQFVFQNDTGLSITCQNVAMFSW